MAAQAPAAAGAAAAVSRKKEYRCPKCTRLLIIGTFALNRGEYAQAFCGRCKAERRFWATIR